MENNQNKRSKNMFQSRSVLATFALAFVALIAIVVAGINQTSYAIPEIENKFPDTFVTAQPESRIIADTGFTVLPYHTTDGLQVFCMEHTIGFAGDTTFNKGDAISDYGLLYLMANIYPHKPFKDSSINANEFNEDVQTWISQVAIWVYLYETDSSNEKFLLTAEELENIKNAKTLQNEDDGIEYKVDGTTGTINASDKTFYDVYIAPLVASAKANRNTPNKVLKIDMSDKIDTTSDGKYYQSSAITVAGSPSDNFNGYEVGLVSAPEGSIIVDVNGTVIEDLTNLLSSDKFYIRVPVDKVTEQNKVVSFKVTGSFTTYEGNYYIATGAQTISSVDTVTNNVESGAQFTLNPNVPVDDTGMSTAQTVYFIGLIVLLSGVGIIYANVKPTESK